MKNDIKYLMECQNLSEYQDTLTGLLNRKGFSHELHLLIHKNEEPEQVFCILLQTAINADHLTLNNKSREISVHQEISGLCGILCQSLLLQNQNRTPMQLQEYIPMKAVTPMHIFSINCTFSSLT